MLYFNTNVGATLIRYATALRVTAPLGYGSRRLVWPKGSFRPVHTARPPLFPREQRVWVLDRCVIAPLRNTVSPVGIT